MSKWGVMLTRAQPFHMGHLYMIKEILNENDEVLLMIGSANKVRTKRNPLSIKTRMKQVKKAIQYYLPLDEGRIKVVPLDDWSMENYSPAVKEWGNFLYYSIVFNIGVKSFNFYYNDDISTVLDWFVEPLQERVNVRTMDRSKIADGVSATKVRDLILHSDYNTVMKYMPKTFSLEDFMIVRKVLKQVEKEPKGDFIMK